MSLDQNGQRTALAECHSLYEKRSYRTTYASPLRKDCGRSVDRLIKNSRFGDPKRDKGEQGKHGIVETDGEEKFQLQLRFGNLFCIAV